ncbi:hypothetical protein [Nocardioides convexus]|uniref:hypothetical protein n=1 Tax=Nocardioides convexus TaxID=2712224 RepID=UPI002418B23A|nr:hypothetical protein [Nocardioides convexus]
MSGVTPLTGRAGWWCEPEPASARPRPLRRDRRPRRPQSLFPGLYRLSAAGRLPDHFAVIGSGRHSPGTDDEFRDAVRKALEEFVGDDVDAEVADHLLERIRFVTSSADDGSETGEAVRQAEDRLLEDAGCLLGDVRRLLYLSVPPGAVKGMVGMLDREDLVTRSRLVTEKPFGVDLATARDLQAVLGSAFDDDQVFRIDHFLGKEAAQNILALRFANGLFEPAWNRHSIESVQIDVPEKLTVEGRGRLLRGHRLPARHGDHPPRPACSASSHSRTRTPSAPPRSAPPRPRPSPRSDRSTPSASSSASTTATARSPTSRRTPPWRPSSPPRCGSTTTAGATSRSTCAPARRSPRAGARSRSASAIRGTAGSSPRTAACRSPTSLVIESRRRAADRDRRARQAAGAGHGARGGGVPAGPRVRRTGGRSAGGLRAAAARRDARRPDAVHQRGGGRAAVGDLPAGAGPPPADAALRAGHLGSRRRARPAAGRLAAGQPPARSGGPTD